MRLKWDANLAVDIDVAGLDAPAAVARLLSHPDCVAAIETLAKAAVRKAKVAVRLDDKDAAEIARTCLRDGREAAIAQLMAVAIPDATNMANEIMRAAFRKADSLPSSLRDSLDREMEEDLVDIVDAVREGVGQALVPAIRVAVLDGLGKRHAVEVRHEADSGETLSFSGPLRGVATVEADSGLATLFEITNADAGAFVNRVQSRKGVDLRAGDGDARLLSFLEGHSFGHSIQGAKAAARLWSRFSPRGDAESDPALTSDEILAVLEKAPRGAVPACVARMPLARLLEKGLEGILADADGVFVGVLVPGTDEGWLLKARAGIKMSAAPTWRVLDGSEPDEPGLDPEEAFSLPGYR